MQRRRSTILPPLLWSIGAVGALAALARVGRGDPRFDVPSDPTTWPQRWSGLDPLDAAAAIGRWVALVLLGYLAVVALLHLAAALAPRGRLRRVARAATPRFLTGLLAGAVVVAGSSAVGATAPDDTTTTSALDGSNPPVMRVIEAKAPHDTVPRSTTVAAPAPTTTTTTTIAPAPSAATPLPYFTSPAVLPSDPGDDPTPAPPAPSTGVAAEVVVAPGDHLWAIAERTVAQRLGPGPGDTTIADYWRRLIVANHDRLVDPQDPSLIHPGQRLVLPR